jgi:sulfane dehydrogenase subunit SoxC
VSNSQSPQYPPMDPAQTYLSFPLGPHGLLERVTPVHDLFVLAHLGVPRVDPERWSLGIEGLVERPLRLTLSDLKDLPSRTVEAFLQCAGNPATPDVPARLISNVVWKGVDLQSLLDTAGVGPEVRFVWSFGLDRGEFMGVASGPYLKDLPLERVRAGGVLVAYEMNGEPLTPEHGFPARLLVPGFYGTNSVKWLYRIELADRRAAGPFTTTFYNDRVTAPARTAASGHEGGPQPTVEPTHAVTPVWSVPPESVIVSPAAGSVLSRSAGSVAVWGWAWADAGVSAVEVSVDGGQSWSRASVEPPRGRAWQRFAITWSPDLEGERELQCRARDALGQAQPIDGKRNAIHRVPIRVGV